MNRQLWPTGGCVKGTRADAPYFYLGRSLEFVPIHRAVHQVEELRFRQLALLGHLGEKIIRNLSHPVARLGFRQRFLALLSEVNEKVMIAFVLLKAFRFQRGLNIFPRPWHVWVP